MLHLRSSGRESASNICILHQQRLTRWRDIMWAQPLLAEIPLAPRQPHSRRWEVGVWLRRDFAAGDCQMLLSLGAEFGLQAAAAGSEDTRADSHRLCSCDTPSGPRACHLGHIAHKVSGRDVRHAIFHSPDRCRDWAAAGRFTLVSTGGPLPVEEPQAGRHHASLGQWFHHVRHTC